MAALVNSAIGRICKRRGMSEAQENQENRIVDVSAKDPVCGMDVNPKKSYSATHGETEYRFCSLSCLEKFKADPERFVRR